MQDPEVAVERPLDQVAVDLMKLRADAGLPSFGDLARRVGQLRQERGLSEHEARVGRTTVYDVFRTGRSRLDPSLVADVVRALGGDEVAAAGWEARCLAALGIEPGPVAAPSETLPEQPATAAGVRGGPLAAMAALCLALVLVNLLGRVLSTLVGVPLHLDMIGTASAAIAFGPWWGAGVGLVTNVSGALITGPSSLAFAAVNVVGGLLWGWGVRRWALGRSLPRFFVLNVLVALACSLIAVPVVVAMGGTTGNGMDPFTLDLAESLGSLVAGVAVSNVLISVADKIVSGFVALVLVESLPAGLRGRFPAGWLGRTPGD